MKQKTRGLTLVEMMITLLLIGISVIALVRLQNYLAYTTSVTQQKGDALVLAIQKQESLRDFQVLNNQNGYTSYQSIASGSSTSAGATTTYTTAWTVTSNANPTYKTIDITVSWTDRYNGSQSIRLVTKVAGIDPANSAAVMGSTTSQAGGNGGDE